MWLALAAATLEIALVLSWILSGTPNNAAQHRWYIDLPLVFLFVPIAALSTAIRIRRATDDRTTGIYVFVVFLLILNLLAFLIYGAMSGGGV